MFKLINKAKNKKGFTLVELLVVLAVLAIISAIAIPKFAGVQASAKQKADRESLESIKKSIELCILSENIPSVTSSDTKIAEWSKANGLVFSGSAAAPSPTSVDLINKHISKYIKNLTDTKIQSIDTVVTITIDIDGTVKFSSEFK